MTALYPSWQPTYTTSVQGYCDHQELFDRIMDAVANLGTFLNERNKELAKENDLLREKIKQIRKARRSAMPWKVKKGKGSRPWKITNKKGRVVGTSRTKKNARASVRARYANEK